MTGRFARSAVLLAAGLIIVATADSAHAASGEAPKPVGNSQGPSCKGAGCYKAPTSGTNKAPCPPHPGHHHYPC
jgi:hypothetical protein